MHRHDFHSFRETTDSTYCYDDDDDVDFSDISDVEEDELKKHSHSDQLRKRRSVDEYLEQKRIRERYKDLFDDYFGENS